MVTVAGTAIALLLLARLTARPPLPAAAFKVIEQESADAPVIDPFTHVSPVRTGTPMPLRATDAEESLWALLAIVSWPDAAPDAVGSNWRVNVMLSLPPTVMGKLFPAPREKDCPVKFSCEISTAADPLFETVTLELTVLPTAT
jgi:hypothetical protein